jgi:hypothetical protein
MFIADEGTVSDNSHGCVVEEEKPKRTLAMSSGGTLILAVRTNTAFIQRQTVRAGLNKRAHDALNLG